MEKEKTEAVATLWFTMVYYGTLWFTTKKKDSHTATQPFDDSLSHKLGSEGVSAAERGGKASSVEQANE